MTAHVLEKLAATNPESEIWWDSSPLIYDGWKQSVLKAAPAEKRADWTEQLTRLFDAETLKKNGRMGFRGVTTNPPLSLQALQSDPAYWQGRIQDILRGDPRLPVEELYWRTYLEVLVRGAQMVLPAWKASGGKYGFLSGQVDPRFYANGERMLQQGLQIATLGDNLMVKIPGSAEGYPVIEELTARGISTNNTAAFSVSQYVACMNAVSRGLERARKAGIDLSNWRSVITHMSARLGNLGDLKAQAEARGIALSPEDVLWGETAVMKRAYHHGKNNGHPSKMLQCSLRIVKNPDGSASSWHLEKIAGGDIVYTCPGGFIQQLMEVEDKLAPFDANAINEEVPQASLEKLMKLPYFRQAYEFDGMKPEEFSNFGAFAATASEFAAATRKTVDFVAQVREHAATRAA